MPATPSGPIAGQEGGGSGYTVSNHAGVWGDSGDGNGVIGTSGNGYGVGGASSSLAGVDGWSDTGAGVQGRTNTGLAGSFLGAVVVNGDLTAIGNLKALTLTTGGDATVNGNLTKNAGSFRIDHPLDPANQYLSHSFVESPDMLNIYNDNVTLDLNGEAIVRLPDWFEALNQDFRYQLTAVGVSGPNLYIAEKIRGNRFKIAGGKPGMEVSWQVTGVRQDAYAEAHRIRVEEDKPEAERGYYLHPELFGQPPEKGIEWAQHPVLMERMKVERDGQDHPVHFPGPDDPSIGAGAETSKL